MKKEEASLLILLAIVIAVIAITYFDNSLRTITGFVSLDDSVNKKDRQDNHEKINYLDDELIIKYKKGFIGNGNEITSEVENEILIYEYLEKPDEIEKITDNSEIYNLKFDGNENIERIINSYKELPEVEYVDYNYLLESFVVPNDPSYNLQKGLKNINAQEAWDLTVGDKNIVIAVIDTGVEYTHEDLISNIWNNTDESCDNATDKDNNNYNGDCRGYDFVDVSSDCSDDCSNEDNEPLDSHGHGTHVAGIASAISNNNLGIAGVCWNCSIMPVRAGYKDSSGNGFLTLADVIQALHYSADNNATIILMSFGGTHSASLEDAVNYSYNKSILVASAGNQGASTKRYPCSYDNVICVAATSNNQKASYSNYGEWVDLAAPGSSIFSTYLNNSYISQSGTSMSAPLVAGSIGLVKSLFNKNQSEIQNILYSTGMPVNFTDVMINQIDVYSAILSLDDRKPTVNLVYPTNNLVNITLGQTFSCEASDWQLKNATLQIWNSSNELYYKESRGISGIFNSSVFNVVLNEDSYKWDCLVYDEKNNYNSAGNFSISTIETLVVIVSPLNNTNTRNNENYFNCSTRTEPIKNLENITFLLWNSSDLVYTKTNNISGKLNSSVFNYNFSEENDYLFGCKAFTNNSELITTANFTIIYDVTNPLINLLGPENGKITNNQDIEFSFSTSDKNQINNCSLIVDNRIITNSSLEKSLIQKFNVNFEAGNYSWKIGCYDRAGNSGSSDFRSFTVISSKDSSDGKEGKEAGGKKGGSNNDRGAGEGRGAGVIPALSKKTYFISREQFSGGHTKELRKNDEIKFYFQNEKKFEHKILVSEISEDYVDITVQSDPIKLKLGIGEEARLNLTNPDYYNLYIKLNSISEDKTNLTIKLISEEIFKSTNNNFEENSQEKLGITGKAVDGVEDLGNIKNIKDKIKKYKIIIVTIFIVITIIIIFLFKYKKDSKENLKPINK